MSNNKTMVINLFGGPGTGKSTCAAYIFSRLKMMGINAELVTEAAKDLTWEESFKNLKDQIYVFGKQAHRLFRCADQVDVIVTDSPIFLSTIYNQDDDIDVELHNLVLKVIDKYNNINIVLKRVKPYNPVGRTQTEAESDAISNNIKSCLDGENFDYYEFDGNIEGCEDILAKVVKTIQILEKLKHA